MRVPLLWLKDYVTFDDTVAGLAEKLTFSGIEVEGIETIGADCPGVVVGEVRAVDPHPNADRLTVCRVFDGARGVEVVCGAPNVRVGGKYPFAPVGTKLPAGFTIRKAKLRGVASEGMLCAEDELGISEDHEGLMELPADATAGASLAEVLGGPETVLDLEITPNRPDCLSMIGLAREVSALYGVPLRRPAVDLAEEGEPADALATVTVKDAARCPRYLARVIRDVRLGPSPEGLRRRLTLAGIRPINNVVDVTNFVLLECGHPLHAFDYDLLEDRRIGVRTAREGETITTLDGVERRLDPAMLLITDGKRPVAVAGVMGGAGSEIGDGTRHVLLESACFAPASIRQTAKRLGLYTESSYRFARGTDIEGLAWASRRAAALLAELAGGKVAPGTVDVYPAPPAPVEIRARWADARALLGLPVEPDEATRLFRALELEVREADAEGCRVRVPTFRPDLTRDVDLFEEFARLHGLDRVPLNPPRAIVVPGADDRHARAVTAARRHLAALGLHEIINYSLASEDLLGRFDPAGAAGRVRLPHPLSEAQSVLRDALLPQMVETLGRNHARQVEEAALFEIGRVFAVADGRVAEEERVAIGLFGPVGRGALGKRPALDAQELFGWARGIADAWMERLGVRGATWTPADRPAYEPGRALELRLGERVAGALGIVRSALAREWRLAGPVAVAEVALDPLLGEAFTVRPTRPPPVYPSTTRDVAFVVDSGVRYADIVQVMRGAATRELESIALFDIYQGKGIAPGRKSMAFSLTYRAPDRTLTDDEANRFHEAVMAALRTALQAEIRDA